MSNIFITADLHFSHKGIVQFLRADGVTKERPWDTIEEMDEALAANWNSVVRPKDKVRVLGDVVINRSALPILSRLNGEKVLIAGNHDTAHLHEYAQYFKDIKGCGVLDGFLLTHIPVHPSSLGRWVGNIHGHLHSNYVYGGSVRKVHSDGKDHLIDPRYLCVSVEHTNFTPISLDEAKKRFIDQQ